jgi:hypothetical protein
VRPVPSPPHPGPGQRRHPDPASVPHLAGTPDPADGTSSPDPADTADGASGADSAGSGDIPAGLTGSAARDARQAAAAAGLLAGLEHQIIAKVLQVVSGPGGAASFLRRHLLGKPLAGPSLPLDVGQP